MTENTSNFSLIQKQAEALQCVLLSIKHPLPGGDCDLKEMCKSSADIWSPGVQKKNKKTNHDDKGISYLLVHPDATP